MEIIILLLIGLGCWTIIIHNKSVPFVEECKNLKANIETEQQRKIDTFNKFSEMIAVGTDFEKTLILQAAEIRTNGVFSIDQKIERMNLMKNISCALFTRIYKISKC